jgi:hypothetical protein
MKKISKEKLAQLSLAEKQKLFDVLEEKKRRKREAREAFVPHGGQLPIITDETKIRLVVCGNGFGKTALGVNEAFWGANGYNPITGKHSFVPAKVYVVLDSPEKVESTWLPEIKKWFNIREDQLEKRGKPYYTNITLDNGSFIRFVFHLAEPLTFESIEADLVIYDEPPPKAVWTSMLRAGRTKGRQARYLMLGTPITQPWLREYYVEWEKGAFPDTKFFKGDTTENKANLADGYIENFARHLSTREQATRLKGDWFNTDGLALAGLFDRRKHVKPSSLVLTLILTSQPMLACWRLALTVS